MIHDLSEDHFRVAPPDDASRLAALNLMEDAIQARRAAEGLNAGLRESERRLEIELAASQQLQSASALLIERGSDDAVYPKLVEIAVAIMQSDMGSLQAVDEKANVLRLLASHGFDPAFPGLFAVVGPERKTSCARAWIAGQRLVVPDVEAWEAAAGTPDQADLLRMGIRSVQSTPLVSRAGRLLGVISTHWRTPRTPTEAALRSLDVLARQAADLIERREAEEATAQLAAIVASSDDAIIGKDLEGVIRSWNNGAERVFGYAADEVIGTSVFILIPSDRIGEEQSILDRLRHGERIDQYETVRQRKDGSLLDISLTVSPVLDAAGRIIGVATIARDITGRKEAEKALQEADRHKNEFLAMLAHELRGPLAPIRNSLQVVRMGGASREDLDSATAIMERQLGHMARLIDDLIDVSRISRGKLELRREPTELTSAVRSVAEATLPICEAMSHELRVMLPQRPIYVDADPVRLAQVVTNLLNNACKFTDRGGRIGLTVEGDGDEAVIRVRDNGIGIAPDYLPRIFDLFTQIDRSMDRSRGGLGIGLSLVKDVVEMHGGTVRAFSDGPGEGSEFVVRLPLIEPSAPAASVHPEVTQASSSRRILVVDDNVDSAESLAMFLRLKGHEVHTVHDGVAAVEEATKLRPEMILLDLGLPRLNGFEVARRVRERAGGERVRLVALTGWGQEDYRRRSEEAGFDEHLVKPVALETLERLLEKIDA